MTALIENTTDIGRTPEDVFDFLSDQRNEPTWNQDCVLVEKLTDGPVGVGTRFRARWKQGPEVVTELTAYERPWTWTYVNGGSIACELTITLEPLPGGGTRLTSRGRWSASGLARLVFPIFVRVMRRAERRVMVDCRHALEVRLDAAE